MTTRLDLVGVLRSCRLQRLAGFLFLSLGLPMSGADPSLHPLGERIAPGEIHFTLRNAAKRGEDFGVECVYRPFRERDVKKSRHLNLLRGWIGSGSKDLIRVQRTEFHSVRQSIKAADSNMVFTVSLRDPETGFEAYQLDAVRIVGGVTRALEFERWFPGTPGLNAGFGLRCDAASLRGTLRPSGLAASPLRGSAPLWPTLRTVDVVFAPVFVPAVQLWESTAKHHWDGWRQTTPLYWPGGRSIVLTHISGPNVWREHEYSPFGDAKDPARAQPNPPAGVMPGVQLEVFWAGEDALEFPEVRFETEVFALRIPLSKMPARMAELLALNVRQRPGLEQGTLSAEEWVELDALAPEPQGPITLEMVAAGDNKTLLKVNRRSGFTEPWLCIFGGAYDDGKRYRVAALLLRPERWTDPLPE